MTRGTPQVLPVSPSSYGLLVAGRGQVLRVLLE